PSGLFLLAVGGTLAVVELAAEFGARRYTKSERKPRADRGFPETIQRGCHASPSLDFQILSRGADHARRGSRKRPAPVKLRRSVAAHPIFEWVIGSNLHHLDIRVASGEGVAGEEPSGWNNECSAVQSQIIILNLHRPIGRERPFDTPAHQPA